MRIMTNAPSQGFSNENYKKNNPETLSGLPFGMERFSLYWIGLFISGTLFFVFVFQKANSTKNTTVYCIVLLLNHGMKNENRQA